MACLETSFLIDLLRGKREVAALKDQLYESESSLAIAAPSITELWSGALLSNFPDVEKAKITELIQSLEILNLDEESAKEAGEIEAGLLRKGLAIQTEDIMIAGIARVHGEKLVTRDPHYARIPGLRVLKY